MLRGMVRLLTSSDVIPVVVVVLLGAGLGALIAASVAPGAARIFVSSIIGLVVLGVVAQRGMGVHRRFRKLSNGKCPNSMCHGVVQQSELVAKDEVVCPTCKKRWPKLDSIHYRTTART